MVIWRADERSVRVGVKEGFSRVLRGVGWVVNTTCCWVASNYATKIGFSPKVSVNPDQLHCALISHVHCSTEFRVDDY